MDELLERLELGAVSTDNLDIDYSGLSDSVTLGNGATSAANSAALSQYGDILSLPVFKMESLGFGEVDNGPRYMLMTPTSPLTKLKDVAVTYLNKGQTYELTLEALGNQKNYGCGLIRCIMRMSFYFFSDIIMLNQEPDHWTAWCAEHPGERVLEVESGYMVESITHDLSEPNLVMFDWCAAKGGRITFKVNCLSSEFSAKRHGGEKGALLRLEIDAYSRASPADPFQLFHTANCHVKIFKDKGADRKHKQEMQKLMSLSPEDQTQLRVGHTMSVFQDFCLDQCAAPKTLPAGIISLETLTCCSQEYAAAMASTGLSPAPPVDSPATAAAAVAATASPVLSAPAGGPTAGRAAAANVSSAAGVSPMSVAGASGNAGMTGTMPLSLAGPDSVDSGRGSSVEMMNSSRMYQSPETTNSMMAASEPLMVDSSVQQTQEWLIANGFGMHLQVFGNFAGVDILKLQRADLKEILGEAEGIRLNNALQTRSVRPTQVFYIVQKEDAYYRGVYLYECSVAELRNHLGRHCQLLPAQIASVQWFTSSGVAVYVDREVLMNLPSESTFRLEKKLRSTDPCTGLEEYDILLFNTS